VRLSETDVFKFDPKESETARQQTKGVTKRLKIGFVVPGLYSGLNSTVCKCRATKKELEKWVGLADYVSFFKGPSQPLTIKNEKSGRESPRGRDAKRKS